MTGRTITDADVAAIAAVVVPAVIAGVVEKLAAKTAETKKQKPLTPVVGTRGADDLADKVVLALADGVPRTAPEIAKSKFVRRRREVVEEVLAADGRFVRVPAPPGRSGRAEVWGLAPRVIGRVGTSRFGDAGVPS
jgi:hypothetical protein